MEYVTHFSFEYPSGYRKVMTDARSEPPAPLVVRFAKATGVFGCVRQTDTCFGVSIIWPSREARDALEAVDRVISGLDDPNLVRERSSAAVAGIPAVQVAYRDPRVLDRPEMREVFFDYGGRIWNIFIYSETSRAEQAKLDFVHVVQTFKILP